MNKEVNIFIGKKDLIWLRKSIKQLRKIYGEIEKLPLKTNSNKSKEELKRAADFIKAGTCSLIIAFEHDERGD